MQVRSILQHKGSWVATVAPTDTVAEAAQALSEHGIGALVVSADGRTLDGILSERDIVRALALDHEVRDKLVAELMTGDVMTCDPRATVDTLMAVMTERRVRHLPIVEDGVLAGIISIGDVVKHRVEELQAETQVLHDYIETGR